MDEEGRAGRQCLSVCLSLSLSVLGNDAQLWHGVAGVVTTAFISPRNRCEEAHGDFVCMYIYAYMYIYMHICIYVYVHICIHVYIHTHRGTYTHTHTHTHTYISSIQPTAGTHPLIQRHKSGAAPRRHSTNTRHTSTKQAPKLNRKT